MKNQSRRRHFKIEKLEERHLLAAGPTLWMTHNNMGSAGDLPTDFIESFRRTDQWEQSIRAIDTYTFDEDSFRENRGLLTDPVLSGVIAPALNEHQVDVALRSGVTSLLYIRDGGSDTKKQELFEEHARNVQSLLDAGLRLKHISLLNVLSQAPDQSELTSWRAEDVPERIADIVDYMKFMHRRFPAIEIGIIDQLPQYDPIPELRADWRGIYRDVQASLARESLSLDHIHVVMHTEYIHQNPDQNLWSWQEFLTVQDYIQDDLGLEFGLQIHSRLGDEAPDAWLHQMKLGASGYLATIEAMQHDQPDRIVVGATAVHPRLTFPEAAPQQGFFDLPPAGRLSTYTAAVHDIARRLAEHRTAPNRILEELAMVPPLAVTATSELIEAENAGFAKALIDSETISPFIEGWSAASSDAKPFIKLELPETVRLNMVRVWLGSDTHPNLQYTTKVFVSQTGIGTPESQPSEWTPFASDIRLRAKSDLVQMRPEVQLAKFVAVTNDQVRSLTRLDDSITRIEAIRVYSENFDWPDRDEQPVFYDYGDLPESYRTRSNNDGPRHRAVGPILGQIRTSDQDGQPSVNANNDIGDDGVVFGELRVGDAAASLTVDVRDVNDIAWLSAWIDFDGDGTFLGPGEKITAGGLVRPNSLDDNNRFTFAFPVPTTAVTGTTYARVRLSSTRHLSTETPANVVQIPDGEVEDYRVTIKPAITASNFIPRELLRMEGRLDQLHAFDLDTDGDVDFVVAGANGIYWFQNDGRQNYTTRPIFADTGLAQAEIAWSNFYNHPNVIAAGPIGIMAFENPSITNPRSPNILLRDDAANLRFADLESRGGVDVLFTNPVTHQLYRLPSVSDKYSESAIPIEGLKPRGYQLADLSGDGEIDLVSIHADTGKLSIHFGRGDGTFNDSVTIEQVGDYGFDHVQLADMDGDGDLDIVANGPAVCVGICILPVPSPKLLWYENDGVSYRTASEIGEATDVFAVADLNGDGLVDIAQTEMSWQDGFPGSIGSRELVIYRNSKDGVFKRIVLATGITDYSSLEVADVNQDGSLDILAVDNSSGNGRVIMYLQVDRDFDGPAAGQPSVSWQRREVTWNDPGATIAKIVAGCCDAATEYQLSVDDDRFEFFLSFLTLRRSVSLKELDAPKVTVNVTLSDRADPRRVFTYPFTFDVTTPIDSAGNAKDRFDYGDLTFYDRGSDLDSVARHLVGSIYLGDRIDSELGPQNDQLGRGDDMDVDGDDDDGVVFIGNVISLATEPGSGSIRVKASSRGKLDAWIDFNGDQVFDADEHLFGSSVEVFSGFQVFDFLVPMGSVVDQTTSARFRISGNGGLRPYDNNPRTADVEGEVEDYVVRLVGRAPTTVPPPVVTWQSYGLTSGSTGATAAKVFADGFDAHAKYTLSAKDSRFEFFGSFLKLKANQRIWQRDEAVVIVQVALTDKADPSRGLMVSIPISIHDLSTELFDFGDAPSRFGTTQFESGPRHRISRLSLGRRVDADIDGQSHSQALGDDNDADGNDDDGVVLVSGLVSRMSTGIGTIVVDASDNSFLDAWIDFNGNGRFDQPEEHLSQNRTGTSIPVVAGMNVIDFVMPAGLVAGVTYARYRLSSSGGLSPYGTAEDGEVEDYAYTIHAASPDTTNTLFWPTLKTPQSKAMDISIAEALQEIIVSDGERTIASFDTGRILVSGSSGDDKIVLATSSLLVSGRAELQFNDGNDELRFDSIVDIDLNDLQPRSLAGLNRLNLRGRGGDQIIISPQSIATVTDDFSPLELIVDTGDKVTLNGQWGESRLVFVDGTVGHQVSGIGSVLHLRNDRYWTDPLHSTDVNQDGMTTPIDALRVINRLARISRVGGSNVLPVREPRNFVEDFFDVSGDNLITALDALQVINFLSRRIRETGLGNGEGEKRNAGNEPALLFAPVETEMPPKTIDDKRSTQQEELKSDEMIARESKANGSIVPLTNEIVSSPRPPDIRTRVTRGQGSTQASDTSVDEAMLAKRLGMDDHFIKLVLPRQR